jgi:hypothetical protein
MVGIVACYLYGIIVAFAFFPPIQRETIFGMFKADYINGSYSMVGDIIPIYPLNMIITQLFTVAAPVGLVALKEVCFRKIPYYRNPPVDNEEDIE